MKKEQKLLEYQKGKMEKEIAELKAELAKPLIERMDPKIAEYLLSIIAFEMSQIYGLSEQYVRNYVNVEITTNDDGVEVFKPHLDPNKPVLKAMAPIDVELFKALGQDPEEFLKNDGLRKLFDQSIAKVNNEDAQIMKNMSVSDRKSKLETLGQLDDAIYNLVDAFFYEFRQVEGQSKEYYVYNFLRNLAKNIKDGIFPLHSKTDDGEDPTDPKNREKLYD